MKQYRTLLKCEESLLCCHGGEKMNLKQLRKRTGLMQYKVAEMLGISRQQYSNIESGKSNINSEKIKVLAEKFQVDPLLILRAWEESKNGKKGHRI